MNSFAQQNCCAHHNLAADGARSKPMKSEPEWLEILQNVLLEALPDARVSQESVPHEGWSPDLRLSHDNRLVEIEVRVVRAPRIQEVEGQLARFALRRAQQPRSRKTIDVLVLALSRFGSRLEEAVRKFTGKYAPNIGWGLIDASERAALVIPHFSLDWSRARSGPEWRPTLFERRDRKLFTDLNCWMLKILMLRNAPDDQWGGPRQAPRHPTELAHLAKVSVSKAHGFASTFQQEGYLRKSGQELRLVRLPALLEAWLQDEKNSSPKMTPVRSFLPTRTAIFPEEGDAEPPLTPEACRSCVIGGMFAAISRGLLHASGRHLPFVHIQKPISQAMRDWKLESCDSRDAQMILVQPLHPHSVFRGAAKRIGGAPLVDLWQVALDAVSSGPRGREQADYIVERVLALQERR